MIRLLHMLPVLALEILDQPLNDERRLGRLLAVQWLFKSLSCHHLVADKY